jgi:glycosyltransferase involved in cell wall biosynthesis
VTGSGRTPRVSVVIPTLDRPDHLTRAIDSALGQTTADIELIVVDDGSPEPASVVADRAADSRIRVLRHESRRGAGAARNTGIRAARGEFIALLDDDDVWEPEKLEKQIARIEEAAAGTVLVYCGYRVVGERTGDVAFEFVPTDPPADFAKLLQSTLFNSSVPLIRRSAIEEAGFFDESLAGAQDRDMWLRLARRGPLAFVPDRLVRCFIHGQQITTDLAAKIRAKQQLLKKYRRDLERDPAIHARHWIRLALICFAGGRYRQARRCLSKACVLHPATAEPYRHLLPPLVPSEIERRLSAQQVFRSVDGVDLYY